MLVSLATYTLFLLDARRQTFWEKLDDYVYYIKAFGNSVEFCFGIFLFFNGAWILLFESGGFESISFRIRSIGQNIRPRKIYVMCQSTLWNGILGGAIRAFMMGIHAYFNIWCEARAGWGVFMKRRTAVHKISSLPEASTEQLQQFDDVCAICYQVKHFQESNEYEITKILTILQEMTSAKITRCNHYFHGVCLRKWLYVQDRCPFCHEIIMNQEPTATPTNEFNENQNLIELEDDGVEVLDDNLNL